MGERVAAKQVVARSHYRSEQTSYITLADVPARHEPHVPELPISKHRDETDLSCILSLSQLASLPLVRFGLPVFSS